MDTKTYKRCEFIIRQFMSVEEPSPELMAMFHEWLLDGRNCGEKEAAIFKLFEETVFEDNNLSVKDSHIDLSSFVSSDGSGQT